MSQTLLVPAYGGSFTPVALTGARQFADATNEHFLGASFPGQRLTGDFSVQCWIYADSLSANTTWGQGIVRVMGNNGIIGDWGMAVDDGGSVHCTIWDVNGQDANGVNFTSDGVISTSTWYHLVFSRSTSTLSLHVNDSSVSFSGSETTSGSWGDNAFTIGRFFDGAGYYWDGRISGLAVWDGRALTASEITFLYNSGSGVTYGSIGISGTDGSNLLTNLDRNYDLGESSGNAIDGHGTENLTDTNTVTSADGPGA